MFDTFLKVINNGFKIIGVIVVILIIVFWFTPKTTKINSIKPVSGVRGRYIVFDYDFRLLPSYNVLGEDISYTDFGEDLDNAYSRPDIRNNKLVIEISEIEVLGLSGESLINEQTKVMTTVSKLSATNAALNRASDTDFVGLNLIDKNISTSSSVGLDDKIKPGFVTPNILNHMSYTEIISAGQSTSIIVDLGRECDIQTVKIHPKRHAGIADKDRKLIGARVRIIDENRQTRVENYIYSNNPIKTMVLRDDQIYYI